MARSLRISFPGAFHHIIIRGNNQQAVFLANRDKLKFLKLLLECKERFPFNLHSLVLMKTHVHFLLEELTREATISNVMHLLGTSYTSYFNWRHGRVGHLFQGRFRSLLIDKEKYFHAVSVYIHLNPYRAGVVRDPFDYRWSSLSAILGMGSDPHIKKVVVTGTTLGSLSENLQKAREMYRRLIVREASAKKPFDPLKDREVRRAARRGIFLGDEKFVASVKEKMGWGLTPKDVLELSKRGE